MKKRGAPLRVPDDAFDAPSFPFGAFWNDNEIQPPTGDLGLA
ncbi:hypothetical protein A33K_14048 [Burkholderia humptydooensis MSMB43]|uniref:Uncharacterized protein n=1 Tax=Burkholderia humptydooensis MSMB43 TaxID=441157 RepID=A0ABN0GEM1_9BURK|nr:hypothetical protein A33K_14048 [Burkholderia humptydooensis MSMB43]